MSKIQEIAQAVEAGKAKIVTGLVQEALDEGSAGTEEQLRMQNEALPRNGEINPQGVFHAAGRSRLFRAAAVLSSGLAGLPIAKNRRSPIPRIRTPLCGPCLRESIRLLYNSASMNQRYI